MGKNLENAARIQAKEFIRKKNLKLADLPARPELSSVVFGYRDEVVGQVAFMNPETLGRIAFCGHGEPAGFFFRSLNLPYHNGKDVVIAAAAAAVLAKVIEILSEQKKEASK